MKHWRETTDIVERVLRLASMGRRSALATVVDISGSAYRRPGAKFLVEEDGQTLGGVSGGCLEADVREIARGVISSGVPRLLHYDTGSDDRTVWGLGLGCNGSVDIFVQSAADPSTLDTLRKVRALLDRSDTFVISTVVSGPDAGRTVIVSNDISQLRSRIDRLGPTTVFSDVLVAPPNLIVCGAGDDAMPLVAYAADAGFAVTVIDHRPAYLTTERFPAARRLIEARPHGDMAGLSVDAQTLVVVKMHAFEQDRDWLRQFLDTDAPYIGLLGPRARAEKLLELAGSRGGRRVYGPVGLDVGAEGPEQIAISIVAELLAVHARQQPGHLRERGAAIHAI
jgi:xanthine/CO dehydrogenase XdhC/CoxF family maturation factor